MKTVKFIVKYLMFLCPVLLSGCEDVDDYDVPAERDPIVDYEPMAVNIFIEDEDGTNLLSDVEGNWIGAPFSMICELPGGNKSIDWGRFIPNDGGESAYEINFSKSSSRSLLPTYRGLYISRVKRWEGNKLVYIPNQYVLAWGDFDYRDSFIHEMSLCVEELDEVYNIKYQREWDKSMQMPKSTLWVNNAIVEDCVHNVLPKRSAGI